MIDKRSDEAGRTMKLQEDTNYIVSGLERSGTSMMMQVLAAGGVPIAFSEGRKPDVHNPKGYYELEGGKIINRLIQGTFPFESYKGTFIKITAYGLSYLPKGFYKIIYMQRNLEEVLDSMETMVQVTDENREETKQSFQKLNEKIMKDLQTKKQTEVLFVNYNDILKEPRTNIDRICQFIGPYRFEIPMMIAVVDNTLYRQRR
jgi:hypothetical protein